MPKPNNGTLRLPLQPIGLHSPETVIEEPADPVSSYTLPVASTTTATPATVGVDPVDTTATPSTPLTVNPVDPQTTDASSSGDAGETGTTEESASTLHRVWSWFSDKVHEVWDKITGSKSSK